MSIGSRSNIPRGIWDKRCRGKEGDEILIIADGQHALDQRRKVDFIVVLHQSYLCFELIIFTTHSREKVWARFFIHQFSVFEKIKDDEFTHLFEEKKAFFRKRHRHFTVDVIEGIVRNDIATKIIKSAIVDFINYDLYQRILNQPVEQITVTILDLFGNPAEYKVYDLSAITLLSPKPDCLVPVNTEKIHAEAKYKQFLQSERLRKQIKLAVDIMQSNLKAKPFKIAMASSHGSSRFFDFSSMIGSIRASFSSGPTTKYDSNNHAKYPIETPNRGFTERIRRGLSGLFAASATQTSEDKPAIFQAQGSAKIQPILPGPEIEMSSARNRWLKATNKVVHRNLHGQVTELLRERSLLEEPKPKIEQSVSSPGLISEAPVDATNASLVAEEQSSNKPNPTLPLSFSQSTVGTTGTLNTAVVEEVKIKPTGNAVKETLARRLMTWTGIDKNAPISNTNRPSSPARSMNRDPSSKSIISSNNSIGSNRSASEQSLRKFKTQYPLSHQVAAERQSPSPQPQGSVTSMDNSLRRHAEQSLQQTTQSISVEP